MTLAAQLMAFAAALVPAAAEGTAHGAALGAAHGTAQGTRGAAWQQPELPHDALVLRLRERLELRDGRCAQLRPVRPADMTAAQAFVMALSPRSRRSRFHGALRQLPTAVLRQMTHVDFHDHVAWVAEAGCDDGSDGSDGSDGGCGGGPARLVAEARYVRAGAGGEFFVPGIAHDDEGSAEFALAIADDWQGLGLGRALMLRLMQHARQRGLIALHGLVLADNQPMRALLRRLGAEVRHVAADASLVRATLTL